MQGGHSRREVRPRPATVCRALQQQVTQHAVSGPAADTAYPLTAAISAARVPATLPGWPCSAASPAAVRFHRRPGAGLPGHRRGHQPEIVLDSRRYTAPAATPSCPRVSATTASRKRPRLPGTGLQGSAAPPVGVLFSAVCSSTEQVVGTAVPAANTAWSVSLAAATNWPGSEYCKPVSAAFAATVAARLPSSHLARPIRARSCVPSDGPRCERIASSDIHRLFHRHLPQQQGDARPRAAPHPPPNDLQQARIQVQHCPGRAGAVGQSGRVRGSTPAPLPRRQVPNRR